MSDESESEEFWFEVRPTGVGRKQPRAFDAICSVSSDSSSSPDATSARWYETFETRVASSQSTPRMRDTWVATWRLEKKFIAAPPSQCRIKGRHCFAWVSRNVRDAGGSLASQSTCRKSRLSGGGPMHEKEIHRCSHPKCRKGEPSLFRPKLKRRS